MPLHLQFTIDKHTDLRYPFVCYLETARLPRPFNPFVISHFRTLFRNGANLTLFLTATCALFCP